MNDECADYDVDYDVDDDDDDDVDDDDEACIPAIHFLCH